MLRYECMDDTIRTQQSGQQPVQQQSQPSAQLPVSQGQQPAQPVSGPHRERAPLEAPVADYVQPSGHDVEPQVPQEVREAGVETKSEVPQLPLDVQQAGVTHAKEVTAVTLTQQQQTQLPYSYQQAHQIQKTGKKDDSQTWFAALITFLLKRMSLQQAKGEDNGSN